MAKSKALVDAEARIAALQARLDVATEVYRHQKAFIAALEAQLAARGGLAIQRMGQRTVKRYITGAST